MPSNLTNRLVYSPSDLVLLRKDQLPITRKLRRRLWYHNILARRPVVTSGLRRQPVTQHSQQQIPVRVSSRPSSCSSRNSFIRPRVLAHVKRIGRHEVRSQKFLSFGLLNVRSLNNKVFDILDIRDDLTLDVILLVETWHDPDSVCVSQLRNLSYNVIECSRPRRSDQNPLLSNHGGLVAFSHSRVALSVINIDIKPSTFEFVCFRILACLLLECWSWYIEPDRSLPFSSMNFLWFLIT